MGRHGMVVACFLFVAALSCSSAPSPNEVAWDAPEPMPDLEDGRGAGDVASAEDVPGMDRGAAEVVALGCQPGVVPHILSSEVDDTFEVGPYLMDLRPDRVVVAWRTVEEGTARVVFGEVPEALEGEVVETAAGRYHQLELGGLSPMTDYYYQAVMGETRSAVHRFVTPGPDQPVRFVVWGDNQNGPDVFSALQPLMMARGPHALLGVGDHIHVGKEEWRWLAELFGPARALLHQVPLFAAIGNHEENASFWFDFFAYPAADVPEDEFSESYYSFTFGTVFVLVINTNTVFFPIGDVDTPISAWVKEQVTSQAAQDATWRIAYGHEPGISESWSAGDCGYDGYKPLRNWFLPFIEEHGFHLYMAGHTHDYERAQLAGGMLHIITGGGGGGLDEWCKDFPETTVVYQNHHFLTIDADCHRLRIEAQDIDGKVFDWVELDAGQPGVLVDEGPMENMPPLVISADSPTLD
jgi:hypothetical protein